MLKKIMNPNQIIRKLAILLVGTTLALSAFADGATDTVGYSTFNAQVVAGSNDTIGSPTSYRAGDTIQWTGVYSAPTIDYPQWKEHIINFPGGQPYVAGETKAMYGYNTAYKMAGAWSTAEPANGALIEGVKFTYKPKESILTSPPSPSVNLAGGGDGYEVVSFQGKLYVVNHHATDKQIKCFDAVTSQACVGWLGGKTLGSAILRYKTAHQPMTSLNRDNGNLWFVAMYHDSRDNTVRNGFSCFNLLQATDCGFVVVDTYAAEYAGFAIQSPNWFQRYTGLVAVGDNLFSLSYNGNVGCVNSTTGKACVINNTTQPYRAPAYLASYMNSYRGLIYHVSATRAENRILFLLSGQVHCFDTSKINGTADTKCDENAPLNKWPINAGGYGPRLVLNPDGSTKAACMGGWSNAIANFVRTCFDMTAKPYTLTAVEEQMTNDMGMAQRAYGPSSREMSYKTRTFVTTATDKVDCFDFALGTKCPNFPKTLSTNLNLLQIYTIVPDPERFDCMWANGDRGYAYSFDAMGGPKCSGSPNPPMTLISKPRTAYLCTEGTPPTPKWRSIALSADAGITVTAKIYNAITTNLISTRTIPVGQRTVSIADIDFETNPELKVELTLSGQIGNEKAVAADIVWDGPEQQFCAKTKPSAEACVASADWFGSSGLVGTATPNYSKTINGKGLSLSALLDGFNIAASVSSIRNEDKPLIFRARFDEKTLSGEMTVARLDEVTGLPGPTLATASGVMGNAATRNLLTQLPNGSTISLRWDSLTSDQKIKLNKKLSGTDDTKGEARVNFLRGETSDEGGTTGLRIRSLEARKMGMVVSSGTIYLPPRALMGYSEVQQPGYAEFVVNPTRQKGMVFLAANDGFIHGFKVSDQGNANVTLTHQFGYFPKRLLSEVQRYTDGTEKSLRSQPYFNDNTPMIADVKLDNGFATVLVNAFGRGAQGFAALNITQADSVTETTSNLAIREFTEKDDDDMGYIISQPAVDDNNYSTQIVHVKRAGSKRPAVIVGNGINSRNARGALFVVYLDAAGGYDKIVFNGLNNGLATPRVIDVDANGTADKVYVGDLLGNLWSVNITDTSQMTASKVFTASSPIVSAPLAKRFEPAGVCAKCYFVNFATGQPTVSPLLYDFNPGNHTVYGIWDKGDNATVNSTSLVEQTILGTVNNNVVVSNTTVNYTKDSSSKRGWFFNLRPGEMVVANPKYRPGGSMVFFSLAPPGKIGTTCSARSGWTYNLIATSGNSPKRSFDSNKDGVINSSDIITYGGKDSYAGGEESEGIMGNVQMTSSHNSIVESLVNPSGNRELIGTPFNAPRRLNWQELQNRN